MEINKIYLGDCLDLMRDIKDKSVDMILCDLPYGTTACKWDSILDLDILWSEYNRVIKDNGAIVLTSSQPFTTTLISSNIKMFKYNLIWQKEQGTDFFMAKKKPLKNFEEVCVFYKNQPTYNPQMVESDKAWTRKDSGNVFNFITGQQQKKIVKNSQGKFRYPLSIMKFSRPMMKGIHPTQKPVKLFEYLIKTYSNKGELILDNCAGSGTTAISCINTDRNFILIEKDETYFKLAKERIKNHVKEQDKC